MIFAGLKLSHFEGAGSPPEALTNLAAFQSMMLQSFSAMAIRSARPLSSSSAGAFDLGDVLGHAALASTKDMRSFSSAGASCFFRALITASIRGCHSFGGGVFAPDARAGRRPTT